MQGIREYLLSVTAAAILCAIVKHIAGDKGSAGKIIHIITGLFLVITLMAPLIDFHIDDLENFFSDIQLDAEGIVANGSDMAKNELSNIIKQKTETYILDEANRLGAQMKVEVRVSDSYPPEPYQVIITGSVSPYQKQNVGHYISQYLGISQENQIWS